MAGTSDKIFRWFAGNRETIALRYSGWWVHYPKPSCSLPIDDPPEGYSPGYCVGDLVRLQGKPDRIRRILAIEWHRHRHEFVYIVETSARYTFGLEASPYWFAPQLVKHDFQAANVSPN